MDAVSCSFCALSLLNIIVNTRFRIGNFSFVYHRLFMSITYPWMYDRRLHPICDYFGLWGFTVTTLTKITILCSEIVIQRHILKRSTRPPENSGRWCSAHISRNFSVFWDNPCTSNDIFRLKCWPRLIIRYPI